MDEFSVEDRRSDCRVSLGRLINQLSREIGYWIGRELQPFGLGKIDFDILSALEQEPDTTQETLVSILRAEKSAVAKSLRRLEEKRIVVRRKDARDGRRRSVAWGEEADRFFPVMRTLRTSITDVLAQDVDRDEAAKVLSKMAEALHRRMRDFKEERSAPLPSTTGALHNYVGKDRSLA